MKKKKFNFILLMFIMMMLIGKVNNVHAASYRVTLDGVNYACESRNRLTGKGYPKSNYPSREQARIECESNQINFINSVNDIYIFDDPSTCKFTESDDLYNCDCNITVYKKCKKVNSRQNPIYSEQHTVEVRFMTESSAVLYKKTCEITGSSLNCQVTLPKYSCENNKEFNGWVPSKNGSCYGAIADGTSLYLRTGGQMHTYWTYYPCCGTNGKTNNATPKVTPYNIPSTPIVTPKETPYSVPSTPNVSENNSSSLEENNTSNDPVINQNPINETNKTDNNEENNKSNNYFIVIIIAILILIIIILLFIILHKKNSNNSKNNKNNGDTFDSNSYYY